MTPWVLLWINDIIQFLYVAPLLNNLAIHVRFKFENAVGKLCEALIPVRANYCMGRKGRSIAICTLASMKLLDDICRSPDMMDRILIVGRLLSENRGIDAIIRFTLLHDELHHIILCGKESIGINLAKLYSPFIYTALTTQIRASSVSLVPKVILLS